MANIIWCSSIAAMADNANRSVPAPLGLRGPRALGLLVVLMVASIVRFSPSSLVTEVISTRSPTATVMAPYRPSSIEVKLLSQAEHLGYHKTHGASGCAVWHDSNASSSALHQDLREYRSQLHQHSTRLDASLAKRALEEVTDVRQQLQKGESRDNVCRNLDILSHANTSSPWYEGFAPDSLSWTSNGGYVEPLLPQLRHPDFCFNHRKSLFRLDYLLHDFGHLCRQMTPHSRKVFFDLGASLSFHGGMTSPALYIPMLYSSFGFAFDHIYAYELKGEDPAVVYAKIPQPLLSSYHWFNVGVSREVGHRNNPLTVLLDSYSPDDLVVVKLDIDTPALEMALIEQILANPRLHALIDHLYFEHHVHMREMPYWGKNVNGTVLDSLELFAKLRGVGIASHHWV